MDKQIIVRVFEIENHYRKDKKGMERHLEEYCRIVPGKGTFLSNSVWFYMGYMCIYHPYYQCETKWREYKGERYFSDFKVFPFNEKKMLKGTQLEYAPIDEFKRHFFGYNFIDGVERAGYKSFELLWKLKLYNLAFEARKLNKDGSFYKRFGLTKDYLEFMQHHNIDYDELRLLRLLKVKDINLIRDYTKYRYIDVKFLYNKGILKEFTERKNRISKENIEVLKKIERFIPLKKLKNYTKGLKYLDIYKDYLEMSEKLALNYRSRKDLFPRNLISRHDKMQKKIKVVDDMNTQFGVYLRYLELSKYMYEDEKYIVFPAPSVDSIKEEGEQQGNCVAKNYLIPYKNRETEIFFIRELNQPEKSFITLEYKNNHVKQKELAHHSTNFSKEQEEFINKWVMYRDFIDKKEKYKNKNIDKESVRYDLNKLVA